MPSPAVSAGSLLLLVEICPTGTRYRSSLLYRTYTVLSSPAYLYIPAYRTRYCTPYIHLCTRGHIVMFCIFCRSMLCRSMYSNFKSPCDFAPGVQMASAGATRSMATIAPCNSSLSPRPSSCSSSFTWRRSCETGTARTTAARPAVVCALRHQTSGPTKEGGDDSSRHAYTSIDLWPMSSS